jgi:superfamily I DNA and/or RNA helicase/very-short-patch-repair endonuclease
MQQLDSDSQRNLGQKIAMWKARLAHLGRRNPLIKFRQDGARTLEIMTTEPDVLFKTLTEEKKVLRFRSDSDTQEIIQPIQTNGASGRNSVELSTRQLGNEQLKRLKKLRSEARVSLEERGVNSLFLAFGTLTWYDKDRPDEALLSPLILVPVGLIKEPRRDVYKISILEEDIVLNPTLLLKLKQTFGIELPEGDAIQEITYRELLARIHQLLAEQKTWQIQENIFLSLFSYAKAAIVRDIMENESRICSHPILQAISGDIGMYQSNYKEPLPESALDSRVKPEKTFQVLDADSSQQVVIEAAKAGSSFFVQGPPGTGKSQTIVNMISELIGNGKSVLLVAEKDTALRVVYQRMFECGLDHVCLNLHHSGTTDKRKLVENLSKTIEHIEHLAKNSEQDNHNEFFTHLASTRQSISSYLADLHTKEKPLDKSPFELFGELLKKRKEETPDLDVRFPDFHQWSQNRLNQAKYELNQLSKFPSFFYGERTTIWERSTLSSYSYELELEIKERIEDFQHAITEAQKITQQLQMNLRFQPLPNLEALERYVEILSKILNPPKQLPKNWIKENVETACEAFEILKIDTTEIEEKQLSLEALSLLDEISNFLPFLREEVTNIWVKSNLQSFSKEQQLDLHGQFTRISQDLSKVQSASKNLQETLRIEFSLNLEQIEKLLPIFEHILEAPSDLPDHWSKLNIQSLHDAFEILSRDIYFLESNEFPLKQQYSPELFSSKLEALNSRFQRYSHFWILRVFNLNYRKDIKYLKKIYRQGEKKSHDELKSDLEKALQVQARRNELHRSEYLPNKIFRNLFDPEFSSSADLDYIKQALEWLTTLPQDTIPTYSLQNALDSKSIRQEMSQSIEVLRFFPAKFKNHIDFILRYFHENEVVRNNTFNQLMFSDLIGFSTLAASDLLKFPEWLRFKEVHEKLEQLNKQEFINALREDKANPITALQHKLNHENYLPSKIFSSVFNPNISKQSDLKSIKELLDWLIDLQGYKLSTESINAIQEILDSSSKQREVNELMNKVELIGSEIQKGLEFVFSYFSENDVFEYDLPRHQVPFADLERFLNVARSDLASFQEWLTYKETCEKIENLGAKKFLAALRDSRLNANHWFPILEKLIYQTCLDSILTRKPELKNFNFEVHERQLREFTNLDYSQLDVARNRLQQLHAEHWKNWEKTSVAQSELPRLKKEATKKKQHLPIRKLLNDKQKGIQNLARTLKPCWMMSPLSVSQYIDPDVIHFDVLIFDEASQLRTEDVISSIIRSDQVIVIGDRKQLPPTSFFSTGENEEDTDDENDESYESILDECSNFMFGRILKWHYRSQDERLIAFSNLHFYDSQLITFPNPIQNPDLGVWFKHVADGVYDRGGRRDNKREAAIVAQLVLEHIQQTPEQTLGIIAFSEAQADAIQEQIEILGRNNPNLEDFCRDNSPRFFLKALENVQGDERDVILLSIGYARDSNGKLSLNFGPLNKKGGERRLNVAITRAKSKITLVSSILASEIDLTHTQSEGIRLLHDYLGYAASGGERLQSNSYSDNLHFDSPFEEDVYQTIKQHSSLQDYIIRTQVGCSGYRIDLAIAHNNRPGEFLLGIECDGASYHSSSTARDRDRLRQQVLEKLGWSIHRIWSTEWFHNKPEQVRLLVDKIRQLQKVCN